MSLSSAIRTTGATSEPPNANPFPPRRRSPGTGSTSISALMAFAVASDARSFFQGALFASRPTVSVAVRALVARGMPPSKIVALSRG